MVSQFLLQSLPYFNFFDTDRPWYIFDKIIVMIKFEYNSRLIERYIISLISLRIYLEHI